MSFIATDAGLPLFEGYLEKRQKKKLMAKWSRRYVILHKNKQIRYYLDDTKDEGQMKIIDLNKVNVVKKVDQDHGKDYLFCFDIYGASRKWRFAAESEALRTEWCDRIQNVMFQEWVQRTISVVAEKKVNEELNIQKHEWDHRREELEREKEQIERSLQSERRARNKSVRDLEEIKRSFELEREDVEQRRSVLQTQKDRLREELRKYRIDTDQRLAQLESQYNDDLKQRDEHNDQLRRELRDLSSKSKATVRERDSLQKSFDDLHQQYRAAQNNYKQMHEKVQQLQKIIDQYEQKAETNNAADSKLVALTRTMAAKQKAWNKLRDELTDENDQLINSKSNLEQQVTQLKQKLNAETNSTRKLSKEIQRLRSKNQTLNNKVQNLNAGLSAKQDVSERPQKQVQSETELLKREILELRLQLGIETETSKSNLLSDSSNAKKLQTQIGNVEETQDVNQHTWKMQKKQIFTEINNKIKETVLCESHKIIKSQINKSYLTGAATTISV